MEKGLVSIVIPVYKTEKYLDRCVESAVRQTYKKLEVILIDDGSPDRCPSMCDEWEKKDARIRVIHKENGGLGMARNTGIENARGEYICFLDSDDTIDATLTEKCMLLAGREKADIVVFGYRGVSEDGKITRTVFPEAEKTTYTGSEVLDIFLPSLLNPFARGRKISGLWLAGCSVFCSARLIGESGWRFVSEREIISEDTYSLTELFSYVKTVSLLSEALYFYRVNPASLSHVYRPERVEMINRFYDRCICLADRLGYGDTIKKSIAAPYLSNIIGAMKIIVRSDMSFGERFRQFRAAASDEHLRSVLTKEITDGENTARRILWLAIRHRLYAVAYLLVRLKA